MKKGLITLLFLLIVLSLYSRFALAVDSTNFAINWDVIGGSEGGIMTSVSYDVNGTVGQPIIGFGSGDNFQTGAGYWYGDPPHILYLPVIFYGPCDCVVP